MGLIFNGNGDVIKAVDGSLTVEGLDFGGISNVNAGIGTFSGNLNVGGVLTYEDVKNVDSVGIVTARAGIHAKDDVTFYGVTSGRDLLWDKSADTLNFKDNTKLKFGDSGDLEIFHDGSQTSYVQSIGTARDLVIKADRFVKIAKTGNGAIGFQMLAGNEVGLYHGGNKKINTTSTGVTVTGDITISDKIIHAGDTNTAIRFPAADTVSVETAGQQNVQVTGTRTLLKSPSGTNTTVRLQHQGNSGYGDIILDRQVNAFIISNDPSNASNNASYFSVKNKGNTNLYVKNDGKIGINTTTPYTALEVQGDGGTNDATITFTRWGTPGNDGIIGQNFYRIGTDSVAGIGAYRESAMDDAYLAFHTQPTGGNYTERLRITSNGQLLSGLTTPYSNVLSNQTPKIQLESTTVGGSSMFLLRDGTDAGGPFLFLGHGRGGTTIVQDDDELGQITFVGADGTNFQSAAAIKSYVDGTPGSGTDMPGRLSFWTSPDNSTTMAERLRIDSSGNMCLGGTPFSQGTGNTFCIHSSGTGGGDHAYIYFTNGDSGHSASNGMSIGLAANQVANIAVREAWPLAFSVNGSERLRIDSSGRIGINNTSPNRTVNITSATGGNCDVELKAANNTGWCQLIFSDTDAAFRGGIGYEHQNNYMAFYTGAQNERLRINSNGYVMIGTTSTGYAGYGDALTVYKSNHCGITIRTDSTKWGALWFADSTSGDGRYIGGVDYSHTDDFMRLLTGGTERIRIQGTGTICQLKLFNYANTNASATCEIQANHDIRDSSKIVFGRENANDWSASWASQHSFLAFHTFNGSSNLGERMRITSTGYMGINTTSPQRYLHIVGNDGASGATLGNSDTQLVIDNTGTNGAIMEFLSANNGAGHIMFTDTDGVNRCRLSYHHDGDYFRLDTGGGERLRISSTGRTYINTTSPIDGNSTVAIRGAFGASGCGVEIKHQGNQGSNRDFIRFYNVNSAEAGSIEHTSTTAVAFQTSSDHRLKENVVDITDGIERLKLLKPRKFSWIDDPELGLRDGFIAHEVSPVIPHCVSGEKDAVKEDGSIQTQTMEYSQLTPLLTAALQEAIAEIENLKAEVAALKSS